MNWKKFAELKSEIDRPFIMAHRGASAIWPENTLAAFQQAVSDGADVLETDLRFTKDDEIILIHDEALDRTIDGTGYVRDYTLHQLKQLKVKQLTVEGGDDESPPSLQDLIDATTGQVPLALELKDPLFTQPRYAEKLVNLLGDYGILEQCIVVSFYLERLQMIQSIYPALATGWITLSNLSPNHPVEFLGPFWPLLFLNPFYMIRARKLGKIICPLDPAPEARLGLYLRFNLDVIMTDNPAVIFQTLAKKRQRKNSKS